MREGGRVCVRSAGGGGPVWPGAGVTGEITSEQSGVSWGPGSTWRLEPGQAVLTTEYTDHHTHDTQRQRHERRWC